MKFKSIQFLIAAFALVFTHTAFAGATVGYTAPSGGTVSSISNTDGNLTITSPTTTPVINFAPNITGLSSIGIGTGTTAAATGFQVVDTGTATPRGITDDQYNTGTNSAQFNARKARGTFASPTTVVTGDILGRYLAWGHDGTNFIESGNIRFTSSGTIATTRVPSQFEVWISTDATPSVLTQAMVVSNAGIPSFPMVSGTGLAYLTSGALSHLSVTGTGNALTALNSITSAAASPLVLATGSFGTAVTFASATGIPTFAGNSIVMAGGSSWVDSGSGAITIEALSGKSLILQSGGSTTLTLSSAQLATFAGHLVVEGVTSTGATGTGNFAFSASPTFTGTITAAGLTTTGTTTIGSGTGLAYLTSGVVSHLSVTGSGNALTALNSITAAASTDLTLNAGSGNQNVNLTASGSGRNYLRAGSTGFTALTAATNDYNPGASGSQINLSFVATSGNTIGRIQTAQNGGTTTTGALSINSSGGNVLFGTTTDNSNGLLQIASSTSATAGIGFGSDLTLYRAAAGTFGTNSAYTVKTAAAVAGTIPMYVNVSGTETLMYVCVSAAQ